ncbi:hypothetical protein [Pseudomonas sp. TCU-HL1]|uniref:hypothetical protein n=1 Tax=Pseudomonas sp. TCU-HL1 TaxID=1856685 RepID=UPI00083D8239|nr:hypothetical protein [Pseudomonas sp. TCU-HL1]AOE83787.1 hypothetical protein THL1_1239 [Pseudomonas sp. TCU-HL1]
MKTIDKKLASKKQGGFVMTSELVLITTTMVIGLMAGMVTMRDAITAEMEDVAEAIGQLDQSYEFNGITNFEETAAVSGSVFGDNVDTAAGDGDVFTFVAAAPIEGGGVIVNSNGGQSAQAVGTVSAP